MSEVREWLEVFRDFFRRLEKAKDGEVVILAVRRNGGVVEVILESKREKKKR